MSIRNISLVELMGIEMQCQYLSDLHYLSSSQRRQLAQDLERLQARDADLRDWNDALHYLTNAPPQKTAAEAKAQLLHLL